MKHTLTSFIALALILVLVAAVSNAASTAFTGGYTHPTVTAPGNNNEIVPITTGSAMEAKTGGLTVTTFIARSNAWLQQQTFLSGVLRGGTVASSISDANSTLHFGDDASKVSVAATSLVNVKNYFQSNTLIPGGPGPVCADTNGTLRICQDVCPGPTMPGIQVTVPTGYILQNGQCVTDDDDVIVLDGGCEYQMILTKVDSSHANFDLRHNNNLYTYDPTGQGQMDVMIEVDSGFQENFMVPHGHLANQSIVGNIGGTTVHARVVDVQPGFINGGEVCWAGY